MSTDIICTVLTGLFLIISVFIQVEGSKSYKLIEYRLTELEKHVKEHNNLHERLVILEEKIKQIELDNITPEYNR